MLVLLPGTLEKNYKIFCFSNVQDFGQQSEPENITPGECRSADFANFNDKYTTFSAVRMLNVLIVGFAYRY